MLVLVLVLVLVLLLGLELADQRLTLLDRRCQHSSEFQQQRLPLPPQPCPPSPPFPPPHAAQHRIMIAVTITHVTSHDQCCQRLLSRTIATTTSIRQTDATATIIAFTTSNTLLRLRQMMILQRHIVHVTCDLWRFPMYNRLPPSMCLQNLKSS